MTSIQKNLSKTSELPVCTEINFSSADKDTLVKFIQDKMDCTCSEIWFDSALGLLNLVAEINIFDRTYNNGLTNPIALKETMSMDNLERLSVDGYIENINKSSGYIRSEILNYLNKLPNYCATKQGHQDSITKDNHGFLAMQIQRALSQLDAQFKSNTSL